MYSDKKRTGFCRAPRQQREGSMAGLTPELMCLGRFIASAICLSFLNKIAYFIAADWLKVFRYPFALQ